MKPCRMPLRIKRVKALSGWRLRASSHALGRSDVEVICSHGCITVSLFGQHQSSANRSAVYGYKLILSAGQKTPIYRISSITSRGYYKFQLMPALGYYSREATIRGRPLFFPQQFNIQPNPFSCPAHELAIIRSACFSVEEKIRRTQESKIENRHGRLRD